MYSDTFSISQTFLCLPDMFCMILHQMYIYERTLCRLRAWCLGWVFRLVCYFHTDHTRFFMQNATHISPKNMCKQLSTSGPLYLFLSISWLFHFMASARHSFLDFHVVSLEVYVLSKAVLGAECEEDFESAYKKNHALRFTHQCVCLFLH